MKKQSSLSEQNRTLLAEISAEIDEQADKNQTHYPTPLGGKMDDLDIRQGASSGQSLYKIFDYASRPRREVLSYLIQNMPDVLDQLLTNTRKIKESENPTHPRDPQ